MHQGAFTWPGGAPGLGQRGEMAEISRAQGGVWKGVLAEGWVASARDTTQQLGWGAGEEEGWGDIEQWGIVGENRRIRWKMKCKMRK